MQGLNSETLFELIQLLSNKKSPVCPTKLTSKNKIQWKSINYTEITTTDNKLLPLLLLI